MSYRSKYQIINLAATENIPIANAKRIINNNNPPQNNLRTDFILLIFLI